MYCDRAHARDYYLFGSTITMFNSWSKTPTTVSEEADNNVSNMSEVLVFYGEMKEMMATVLDHCATVKSDVQKISSNTDTILNNICKGCEETHQIFNICGALRTELEKLHKYQQETHAVPGNPGNSDSPQPKAFQGSFEQIEKMYNDINLKLDFMQSVEGKQLVQDVIESESASFDKTNSPIRPLGDSPIAEELLALSNAELSDTKAQLEAAELQIKSMKQKAIAYKELASEYEDSLKAARIKLELAKQRQQDERLVASRQLEYIQNLLGNIRVMVRIRPLLDHESHEDLVNYGKRLPGELSTQWAKFAIPEEEKSAMGSRTMMRQQELERIFSPEETNNDVFQEVELFLRPGLEGGNVCIFAYGPSATGKTFTLCHRETASVPSDKDGIIPRTMDMIFRHAEETCRSYRFQFELSAIEAYLNELHDLVPPEVTSPKIRLGQERYVELTDWQMATQTIALILEKRQSSSTHANLRSSRSHLVFTLRIRRTTIGGSESIEGRISLVDLAGSEKIPDSADPTSRKEGVDINSSLTDLISMIGQLGRGDSSMTPSRALGKLIRPSFQNGRVLMMTTVSPLRKDYDSLTKPTLAKADLVHDARPKPRITKASQAKMDVSGSNSNSKLGATGSSTPRRDSLSRRSSLLTPPSSGPRRLFARAQGSQATANSSPTSSRFSRPTPPS